MPNVGNAEWTGNLKEGKGHFNTGSIEGEYSYKSRFEGENDKGANPEQLIGAAHASCFSMALANALAEHGHEPEQIQTSVDVTLKIVDGVPTIQAENIEPGPIVARHSTSISPWWGVKPRSSSWASRTSRPWRKGCWPRVLPTGPDQLPLCTADTRSGGSSCRPAHQRGWSGGMVSRSPSAPTAYVAAASARELQAGR